MLGTLCVCVQQQFTANGKLKQDRVGQVSSSDVSIIGGGNTKAGEGRDRSINQWDAMGW